MQEALQAAVARMNNGSGEGRPAPSDMIGAVMAILPRLLQNNGSREEMLDKLDTLQKGDIASLREQMQMLRKQCHRMAKLQEDLIERVHDIQRQQVAAAGAVLNLAQQMARITLIDDISGDEGDGLGAGPAAHSFDYRAGSRTGGYGSGRRPRET